MISSQMEDTETVDLQQGTALRVPAPITELSGFESIDPNNEDTEFKLTTDLSMFEVTDVAQLQEAYKTIRDLHYLNEEKTLCIFFAMGKFDLWCAYIAQKDANDVWHYYAPKDKFYFERVFYVAYMQEKMYPGRKTSPFYKMFHEIAHIAEWMGMDPYNVNPDICQEIDYLSDLYRADNDIFGDLLKISVYEIYYGMIAEENKDGAIAGRKIKLLGLYDMLISRLGVETSCNRTRKMNVELIERECANIGYSWLAANARKRAFA